jgi:cytochrome c553
MLRARMDRVGFNPHDYKIRDGNMRAFVMLCCSVAIVAAVTTSANAADDIEAQAQTCSGCHGVNGTPINASTPNIWGQRSDYLYKQLHDFKSGDRANPVMAAIVKDMSFADLRKLASYFAAKSWTSSHPADTAATQPDGIAMCKACHQPNFTGGPPAPRLAGQPYEYLLASMNNFADGARANNLDMPGFMRSLSEGQRDAMAKYLAGL